VTRNFRIIFVVCEGLPDKTVIFLTVGPHERAYAMREEAVEYKTGPGDLDEGSKNVGE